MADDLGLLDGAAALLRAGAAQEDGYETRRQEWLDRYYMSLEPKVWEISLNGSRTRVEDLPLELVDRVAKETGASWHTVVGAPLADLAVSQMLLEATAAHLGTVPPECSVRAHLAAFTLVADTVPDAEPTFEEEAPLVQVGVPTGTPG